MSRARLIQLAVALAFGGAAGLGLSWLRPQVSRIIWTGELPGEGISLLTLALFLAAVVANVALLRVARTGVQRFTALLPLALFVPLLGAMLWPCIELHVSDSEPELTFCRPSMMVSRNPVITLRDVFGY